MCSSQASSCYHENQGLENDGPQHSSACCVGSETVSLVAEGDRMGTWIPDGGGRGDSEGCSMLEAVLTSSTCWTIYKRGQPHRD